MSPLALAIVHAFVRSCSNAPRMTHLERRFSVSLLAQLQPRRARRGCRASPALQYSLLPTDASHHGSLRISVVLGMLFSHLRRSGSGPCGIAADAAASSVAMETKYGGEN